MASRDATPRAVGRRGLLKLLLLLCALVYNSLGGALLGIGDGFAGCVAIGLGGLLAAPLAYWFGVEDDD